MTPGPGIAAATALWLGILTTAGPCGLAANAAALLYLAQAAGTPRRTLVGGACYTLGRAGTYAALGSAICAGALSAPAAAALLQKYANMLLGPVLILSGMLMVGLLRIDARFLCAPARVFERRGEGRGMAAALLLGIVFGLSLCPLGAVQFFSMVTLAINVGSPFFLPALYGIGTGLPVLLFAALIAVGLQRAARASGAMAKIERHSREITGAVFIAVGLYLCVSLMAS
ncbi:MAG TPA: aromatic aminobenezylarsenical efflux permease ArsG family transporter [Verrucomicrobiae bacterium]|nr:aromatic aminobenezylarsenical efflux permease ArsG family transporter [Verrucomicrobiae bacterium]